MSHSIIIGIAGGSASGKTSIAKAVYEYFKGSHKTCIIKQDDYYKDQSHLSFEERVKTNYDHPFAFDNDLLVEQLHELKKGNTVAKPTYDYTIHNRSDVVETITPRDVYILEGLFVLYDENIRQLCDILVFVDTDADIRFIRRLRRDIEERGRSLDSVCEQYLNTVRPMHEQFVEPSKKYAHIIIPEGGTNTVAIDLLITKIASVIDKKIHDSNSKKIMNTISILLVVSILAWMIAYLFIRDLDPKFEILYLISFISIFITGFFSIFMNQKNDYGQIISAKVLGFRNYLITAEKNELEALVLDDPDYFYNILPYTYALGISEKWINNFEKNNVSNIDINALDYYESNLFMVMSE